MGSTVSFSLDATLAADTIACGRLPLSRLLLMNDARYPWLILVPQRPQVRELFELTADDRAILIEEIAAVGAILARIWTTDKINVAALGNVVAQLHIHIVGRYTGDAAWPRPVWGRLPPLPYSAGAAEAMIARLRPALVAGPLPFSPATDG